MSILNKNFPSWMGEYPLEGMLWKENEDKELSRNFRSGSSINEMSAWHGRTSGGIISRLCRIEPLFKRVYDTGLLPTQLHADLSYIFHTCKPEETVEIKVSAEKAVTDAINDQRDWVNAQLKTRTKQITNILLATTILNTIIVTVAVAVVLN